MMNKSALFLAVFILLSLSSCFASDQPLVLYGFWSGLWHGILSLLVLVIKLVELIVHAINPEYGNWDINLFSYQNEGLRYMVGYVLGVLLDLGLLSRMPPFRRKR